ncbi:MAG: hypothetical protein ACKPKO_62200, partial [Candidatus Fonsibacter sp.]
MVDLKGGSQPPLDYTERNAIYINEPSVYSLILRSTISKAK